MSLDCANSNDYCAFCDENRINACTYVLTIPIPGGGSGRQSEKGNFPRNNRTKKSIPFSARWSIAINFQAPNSEQKCLKVIYFRITFNWFCSKLILLMKLSWLQSIRIQRIPQTWNHLVESQTAELHFCGTSKAKWYQSMHEFMHVPIIFQLKKIVCW